MSEEIGKAYLAYTAYNHKAKVARLKDFDLKRWMKVVKAIEGGKVPTYSRKAKGWSPGRRLKFQATMAKRRQEQRAWNSNGAHK